MSQAIYDPGTGRILRKVTSGTLNAKTGEAVMIVPQGTIFGDLTHYVAVDGLTFTLAERPAAPACALSAAEVVADGLTEIVLTGAPAGASVSVNGSTITADGHDIVITTDLPGLNRVSVDSFPAQLWTETFIGTAP